MYIEPNSTVNIFLDGIPLEPDYQNTAYFETAADQYLWFLSHRFRVFTRCTFIRDTQQIRLNVPYADVYKCNYLMFKNTAFENKWFYAFVTKVEYISDTVTGFNFVIDIMQTWLPNIDYQIGKCFVDREHAAKDYVGSNLVDENINLGTEPVCFNTEEYVFDDYSVYLVATRSVLDDGSYVPVKLASNLVYPLYIDTKYNVKTEIDQFYERISFFYIKPGYADAIVGIYEVPTEFKDGGSKTIQFRNVDNFELDRYKPKNKKLYTYPFSYLKCSTNTGNSAIYRFELFYVPDERPQDPTSPDYDENSRPFLIFPPSFTITGYPYPTAVVECSPNYYAGVTPPGGAVETAYDYSVVISDFPVIPWKNDVYSAYLAQNKSANGIAQINAMINSTSGVVNAAVSGVTTGLVNPLTGIVAGASGLANALIGSGSIGDVMAQQYAQRERMQHIPPQASGQLNADGLNLALGRTGFHFYYMCAQQQYLKQADDYFTMYGYKTNETKIPNLNVRREWTYTKTIGCNVHGNIPAEVALAINSVFDNGIRFWKNPGNIGNYDLDNGVLPSTGTES